MLFGCELAKYQAKGLEAVLNPEKAFKEGIERATIYQSALMRYTQEIRNKHPLYRIF